MADARGVRIGWADLPTSLHAWVEQLLGDEVVEAVSQPGGFSPGTADRVATRTGRRAFVKAVSPAQNERSPAMHRREIAVSRALPASAPAPTLMGWFDDGDWVALVMEDVDGAPPVTPWRRDQVDAVLDALERLADDCTPSPLADLSTAQALLGDDLSGWDRIAADPPPDLDPWAARSLTALRRSAHQGIAALDGDTLVHADLRADNLLVRGTGEVVVVDWPWACRGPRWLDTVMLMVNVRLSGGPDVESLLGSRRLLAGVDPAAVTGVLTGLAGFFLDAARCPPPPGLPTVRGFQRAQGVSTLRWVRERMDGTVKR